MNYKSMFALIFVTGLLCAIFVVGMGYDRKQNHYNIPSSVAESGAQIEENPAGSSVSRPTFNDEMSSAPKPSVIKGKDTLRLLALFQTEDQELASAVILVEGYGAYRYRAGEMLGYDLLLLSILPDKVLLSYHGNIEELTIDKGGNDLAFKAVEGDREVESFSNENQQEVTAEEARKRAFLAHIDVQPVTENAPHGYIVGPGFPKDTMAKTGIEPGDIIVSVNGYPLGEAGGDELAWKSVQTTEAASIVVKREGAEFYVYYP